jgi:hypothetical protein
MCQQIEGSLSVFSWIPLKRRQQKMGMSELTGRCKAVIMALSS